MEKFSIQIFKIGSGYPTPPPPPPGIEKASGNNLVNEFKMVQNYPNPFNPSTTIKYTIPNPGLVSLKIYDALGKEVATLVNEVKEVGSYDAIFDGSKFASGIYFYQIRYNGYTDTKKMLLIK